MGNVGGLRGVWLAIIMLASLTMAMIGTIALVAIGVDLAPALGAGGAMFVGLSTLGMGARRFVEGSSEA